MNNIEKHPIGAQPYYVSAGERINDLAEAIQRYSTTKNYKVIKRWGKEIICLCDLMEIMAEQEGE